MRRLITKLFVRLPDPGDDAGDVPGWVLVTVMTAGLVTALWLVADDQLREIFTSALGRVTGP
jgi:hypothetical protein